MNFRLLICITLAVCSMFASAQQCGTYTGPYFIDGFGPPDRGFKQDPDVILPPESTALSLTVDSPANSATVGTRTIQIFGSFAGPPAAGVAINRVPAIQNDSNFVGLVVLKPGTNTITVKVTKLTGESETVTRTVTYDPKVAPDVDFTSEIQGEHVPIKPRFFVNPKSGLTVTRLQLDFDGDNVDDLDATTVPGNLRFEYKQPGYFTARAVVTLDDGNAQTPLVVRTVTRKFVVVPLPLTRKTLCHVFYRMKDRLAANDIPDAVKSINAELRPEIQAEYEGAPSGAAIAQRLGSVTNGRLGIKIASLTVTFQFRNRQIGGSVGFERSLDGVWRITSL
jgi:Glucodextranase, domain B